MAKMMKLFLPCEVKGFDDTDLTVDHFISTEATDRSGDEVDPDGMILNGVPSVLKQHGMDADTGSEPIARCLSLQVAKNESGARGIRARTQYYDGAHLTPPDNTGRRLYEKAKGGFMPYWSIGFIPHASEPKQGGGRRIKQWECVEYSQVGVPDNVQAKSFTPSDDDAVLDGVIEHRTVDSLDIDAQWTDAHIKEFWTPAPSTLDERCGIRQFKEFDPDLEQKSVLHVPPEGKQYYVQYQKDAGRWSVVAITYPEKYGWTEELASKHTSYGKMHPWTRGSWAPEPTEQKSLTSTLTFNNAYSALNNSMSVFISDLLYAEEYPKEKDIRGKVKELSAYIEGQAIAMVNALIAMNEEQKQKCIQTIERKTAGTADSAPDPVTPSNASDEQPPTETPTEPSTQPDAEAPPEETENVGAQIEDADFEIVADTGGDSSPSDAASDDGPTIDVDVDVLKSFVQETTRETVQGAINSLRGKLE